MTWKSWKIKSCSGSFLDFSLKGQRNFLENGVLFTILANGFRGKSWYYIQLLQSMAIPSQWRWNFENPTIIPGVIRKIRLIKNSETLLCTILYWRAILVLFLGFSPTNPKVLNFFSILFFWACCHSHSQQKTVFVWSLASV